MNVKEKRNINNKPKKMDVNTDLHIKIITIQAKLFEKFRVKIKVQDITNEAINQGLKSAEENIIKRLYKELIITPIEVN